MSARHLWVWGLVLLAVGCGPVEQEELEAAPDEAPVADEVLAPAPAEEREAEPGQVTAFASGDTQWVRSATGETSSARIVRTDRNGNSYTVLTYGANTRFSGVLLPGARGYAVFSHTPSGTLRWSRAFSCAQASDTPGVFDLWVTPGGRSVMVLDGPCSADFGAGPVSGRALLLVLGNGGQLRWTRVLVPSDSEGSLEDASVTVSPTTQRVLVAAALTGSVLLEQQLFDVGASRVSAFLRYTDRGALLGGNVLPSPQGNTQVRDVAYDGTGRLNALFTFSGTVDFGDGARVADGSAALLVARYRLDRTLLWARQYAGDFVGELRFRGEVFRSTTDESLQRASQGFVLGLTRLSGAERWLQLRGRHVDDVDMNVGDGVVVVGQFLGVGPTDPDGTIVAKFVAKHDRVSGRTLWRRVLDYSGTLASTAITPSGRVLACGDFIGTADFGTGPLPGSPATAPQAFLFRMDP